MTADPMDILIREMREDEARESLKLSKKSFGFLEGLFITKPKSAVVAVAGEKIVGGAFYKVERFGRKKLGIVDFIFVDPEMHGKGIGRQTYDNVIRLLWEQGCDALMAIVRDDNVASWGMFAKSGFVRVSSLRLCGFLGFAGVAKLFLTTYGISIGHECYIAAPDKEDISRCGKTGKNAVQVLAYLAINLMLAMVLILIAENKLYPLIAAAFVLSGSVFAGYIATLFSKQMWRFRLIGGGIIACLSGMVVTPVASVFFFIPIVGNWYPASYVNSPQFRRAMAASSISTWVFLLLLPLFAIIIRGSTPFFEYAATVASPLLILKCFPMNPISSYGGGRVYEWNKVVYWAFVTITITAIAAPLIMRTFIRTEHVLPGNPDITITETVEINPDINLVRTVQEEAHYFETRCPKTSC